MKQKIKKIKLHYLAAFSMIFLGLITPHILVAQDKTIWIDVRTEEEWNKGHLENAVLIPYDVITKKIGEFVKNKRQPINLYCRSGRRAEIARKALEQMGYFNVQNRGNYEQLRQNSP